MMRPILGLLSLLTVGPAMAAPHMTASEIRKAIQDKGAKQAVAQLWRSGRWEAFVGAISRGDGALIALAPAIAPGTDGGTAEDLTISLAQGLPKNPRAVLRVLDLPPDVILGTQQVCMAPFIEPTKSHMRAYKARAMKAVRLAYRDPEVRQVAEKCLAELHRVDVR